MKCKSYSQFSNLFTRRLNKVFCNRANLNAFYLMRFLNGAPIGSQFLEHLEAHASEPEIKAYKELQLLMKDNPTYTEEMHRRETPKAIMMFSEKGGCGKVRW